MEILASAKARKSNTRLTDQKEKNKTGPICKLHDCLYRKIQKNLKTKQNSQNRWVRQGHRIQDKYTKINWISIYYQWTSGHIHENTMHNHSNKMKYLSVKLTKHARTCMLKTAQCWRNKPKQISEYMDHTYCVHGLKDLTYSKHVILLKLTYRFNPSPSKIPAKNFCKHRQDYSKIYVQRQRD